MSGTFQVLEIHESVAGGEIRKKVSAVRSLHPRKTNNSYFIDRHGPSLFRTL